MLQKNIIMSNRRAKITGVVLAGGLARRMGGGDKGLILFVGKPLVSYSISAIEPVVDQVIINANRNHEEYLRFGYPVIADHNAAFDGPLAGLMSVMNQCESEFILTIPCDCPLIDAQILERMVDALESEPADCFVACDGHRIHPVVLLINRRLKDSLEQYLDSGQRKIDRWFKQHLWRQVDYSDRPGVFRNINTPEELAQLEQELR